MSRRITFYVDSGANIHSMHKVTYSLEELGYSEEAWDNLSEEQKEEIAREIAFERLEWGYYEE